VTLTITEKGYSAGSDPATSAPARIALGLKARREAGATEPIALVSCDNLTGNGEVLGQAVRAELDEEAAAWFEDHVDVISSMVDRITPSADEGAADTVREQTGFADAVPVVTEPFTEWVIEDRFRGRRPEWEKAGVQVTDDIEVRERRQLRLLSGAHTLMAYAGAPAGHRARADRLRPRRPGGHRALHRAGHRGPLPRPPPRVGEGRGALHRRHRGARAPQAAPAQRRPHPHGLRRSGRRCGARGRG